jgi:hypothetical protein
MPPGDKKVAMKTVWTKLVLTLLGVLVATYLFEIVRGAIPKENRLGPTELSIALLIFVSSLLLFKPRILDRLSHFEISGLKIKLLEVQEQQKAQEDILKNVRLILPLLLPETEREHLRNLASGNDKNYEGSSVLRAELRRLRSVDLIRRNDNHSIREIKDDLIVQLSDYVTLTPLGREWVQRLSEIDASELVSS